MWAAVRRAEDGEELARLTSARLRVLMLDVTDPDSIAEAGRRVSEVEGETGLWGLINNAGISVAGPLELLPLSEVRTQFEVNVIGALAVTQTFLPLLRLRRGRLVNISSIAGLTATPFLGPYSSSKFALEAMSDALRLELAPWGISVSPVEPGAVQSQIWSRATMAATRTLGLRTRFAAACVALFAVGVQGALAQGANRLESVQTNSLPGNKVEVTLRLSDTAPQPLTFTVG